MSKERAGLKSIVTIDCRDLEPPEPMVRVLEALHHLAAHEAILMIHRKFPRLLIPRLKELSVSHEVTEEDEGIVKILIWKEG